MIRMISFSLSFLFWKVLDVVLGTIDVRVPTGQKFPTIDMMKTKETRYDSQFTK